MSTTVYAEQLALLKPRVQLYKVCGNWPHWLYTENEYRVSEETMRCSVLEESQVLLLW